MSKAKELSEFAGLVDVNNGVVTINAKIAAQQPATADNQAPVKSQLDPTVVDTKGNAMLLIQQGY
jgi:hypothetical protein